MSVFNCGPANKEPLSLFKYCVQKVHALSMMSDANTHQSWANYIFSYEKDARERSELMSIVKREYSAYFDNEFQYMFLEEKIKKNFPQFFGKQNERNLFALIHQALEAEYIEQKDPRNRKIYKVAVCTHLSSQEDVHVYKAVLLIDDGDDPHFSDGMPFEYCVGDGIYACEVVEFDYENAILFFSSAKRIISSYGARVVSDATMNTYALMKLLDGISLKSIDQSLPLFKFLNHTTCNLSDIGHGIYPSYLDEMLCKDKSQLKAFEAALSKDITFVWGPPGTGKSYTLATIIMALYHMSGERTVVCCLSNVAVDQLVNKVVDIINAHEPDMVRGEFYRAGRTQDARVIDTDFLYPDDSTARILRKKIKCLHEKIERYKLKRQQYTDEAIKRKAELKDLREKLKVHTDYLIRKVKVVFSTISNFVLNSSLKEGVFENLIVDEASMLAQPQLIALAKNVTKRIILVGDFQQLSPITVAGLPLLRDNVFKLCGIDINHTHHPALHPLLNQRRSNPKLVDIINHSFYNNCLHAENSPYHSIVARAPYSGSVVAMCVVKDGEVRFTRGGTRQNVANAQAVMHLLDLYSEDVEADFSIGIITPYTGQIALLKSLFVKKNYDLDFQERIKIGTVHTFQGSECDVIIFDMVDCCRFEKGGKSYFGRIYAGEQGEQLLNVAVSRAKHKLIVVCDPDFISTCPGGVISDRTFGIFKKFLTARWSQI